MDHPNETLAGPNWGSKHRSSGPEEGLALFAHEQQPRRGPRAIASRGNAQARAALLGRLRLL